MKTRTPFRVLSLIAAAALASPAAHADIKWNGPLLQGPILQGPILQGPGLNGPTLNGPVFQGISLQGTSLNGRASTDGDSGARFVAVTLPSGETINLPR